MVDYKVHVLSEGATAHIQRELDRQVAEGLSPAIGVAVGIAGGLTTLYAGGAGSGSLFRVFSCGKPLVAAVLWRLHDRGLVDWNAPVSEYWPEFASNGKGRVTVDHVLTHRAGLPSNPQIPFAAYGDWGQVVAYLEDAPLEYRPGERMEYHSLTFGWLVGEIASRIAGKPFAQLFEQEVAIPLGLRDTRFTLPPQRHEAVLRLHAAPDFESPDFAHNFDAVLHHQVLMPGGSCISTPADLATFYSVLLNGGMIFEEPWLSADAVREITSVRAEAVDPESGVMTRRTLGMALPGITPNTYACPWESPTFGHGGAGTSTTWGDPSIGVAAAVLNSGLLPRARNRERLHRVSAAIREAIRIG